MAIRGANSNPHARFNALEFEPDPEALEFDEVVEPRTRFVADASRSVISSNSSPDIPFDKSLNPYRGCEHGCAYCYARPSHEYLGLSAGLDFERIIFVKHDAARLLAAELSRKSWKPQLLELSGITDPYQPVERHLKITRSCLEVLLDFRNPVGIITKNHLVTRDIDLLQEMARLNLVRVSLSITSLDEGLRSRLEPRTSTAARRLAAVSRLAEAGIPVHVSVAPLIPAVNDHEVPAILKAASDAGASSASYTILRLPGSVADVFQDWLQEHYPERSAKVLGRVRQMRHGKLAHSDFSDRMRGSGEYASQIRDLFTVSRLRYGLAKRGAGPEPATDLFRVPGRAIQPTLF